jgi:hypothetical protein
VLLIILEAAQMPDTKADLVAAWSKFKAVKGGLQDVHFDDDYSPASVQSRRLSLSVRCQPV